MNRSWPPGSKEQSDEGHGVTHGDECHRERMQSVFAHRQHRAERDSQRELRLQHVAGKEGTLDWEKVRAEACSLIGR